jgi:hypothetical protein
MPETRLRIFIVCRSIASVTAAGEGGKGTLVGNDRELRLGVLTIEVILFVTEISWSELASRVNIRRAGWKKVLQLRVAGFFNGTFGSSPNGLLLWSFRFHHGSHFFRWRRRRQTLVVIAERGGIVIPGLVRAQVVIEGDFEF